MLARGTNFFRRGRNLRRGGFNVGGGFKVISVVSSLSLRDVDLSITGYRLTLVSQDMRPRYTPE